MQHHLRKFVFTTKTSRYVKKCKLNKLNSCIKNTQHEGKQARVLPGLLLFSSETGPASWHVLQRTSPEHWSTSSREELQKAHKICRRDAQRVFLEKHFRNLKEISLCTVCSCCREFKAVLPMHKTTLCGLLLYQMLLISRSIRVLVYLGCCSSESGRLPILLQQTCILLMQAERITAFQVFPRSCASFPWQDQS